MSRPVLHGVTDDLANAMRSAEPHLKDGRAFICVIEEVQQRISVAGLDVTYVPTGKRWNGRRNNSDGVHWRLSLGLADSSLIYRVPESLYQGDSRWLVA